MSNTDKKVTIYDIAKGANVSPGTVSRYINGVGNSRGDTNLRIEEAIKKLNYVPKRAARALKSGKRNLICLAYPESDNPFFFELVSKAEGEVKKAGYSMMISHTHGVPSEELKVLALTKEGFMDGLFLINFNYTEEHFEAFKQVGCPLVLSSLCISPYGGNESDNFDYIGIDVFTALHMTTRHLIDMGHKCIAYIGGSKDICVFRERYEGYCSALLQSGLHVDERYCFIGGYDERAGYTAAARIALMDGRPTAICTASDVIAIGAMKALRERNVRVPEDIAVIGLDNIDFDSALTPPLSSAKMRQDEIGKCAIEFLFRRLQGDDEKPKKIIYQPELVIRESSNYQR
ncbi:MAG: LacI family transcriptional regulator [Clostridiales bacterium]|jgi:DNA-binding LacI/PurR family transcriptional regulator|nr:LacI family transcriptional regulator [Clostridiales bacterium]